MQGKSQEPTFSGYQIIEQLYESANSLVYRARRTKDDTPVILKTLKEEYPSPSRIAWFQREYEVTKSLDIPGTPMVHTFTNERNHWLMVIEDFGGDSLSRLKLAGTLDIASFLKFAIAITTTLGQIHQRHIMHKDINPSNIVLNPTTGQVKIIDFGISTVLSREKPTFRNPNVLEGTLAYMSPEQTGRMNRAMDYRTDFYSLGAAMYELITGYVPFSCEDALSLVHYHIARQPTPPHELVTTIPCEISLIILKLMSKNAEDRYQSAYGLLADLEQCLAAYEQFKTKSLSNIAIDDDSTTCLKALIPNFTPGLQDISDRFLLPQRIYGRAEEQKILIDVYKRIRKGYREIVLLEGEAGIGKTALANHFTETITHQQAYIITGKFEPLQSDTPYATLIQTFRTLVQYILIESDAEVAQWREKLLAALGNNGRVLIDVLPEIELIIGPQPEVATIGPQETQNRFNMLFEKFLQTFMSREHPLVIILDDIQWADRDSLRLIERVMTAPHTHSTLLIASYRENEIAHNHLLWDMISRITKDDIEVITLTLLPLDSKVMTQLIGDMFHSDETIVAPLAEIVVAKTGGNPFFLQEFLYTLYVEALIDFDYITGTWRWNLEQIQAQNITDNVVELLTRKVQRLTPHEQTLLKLASCIGMRFDLVKLAVVAQQPVIETARNLDQAITEGLIEPLGETYKLMTLDVPGLADAVTAEYAFAHNRIHQAVYALIPDTEQQLAHWRIGNLLLLDIQPANREEHIFTIANHLNHGHDLLTDFSECVDLMQYNLLAGKRAKTSSAFAPAYHYLKTAIDLTEHQPKFYQNYSSNKKITEAQQNQQWTELFWQEYYALCLETHTEATEASYLLGNFEEMERFAQTALRHSKNVLDTVKVYEIKIRAYIAQGNNMDAVQTALHVLQMIGIHFRVRPDRLDSLAGLQEAHIALGHKDLDDLVNRAEITDPVRLAAMRILTSATNAAYLAAPELMSLMTFKMVTLSVNYGYTPISAHAYASYGAILCGDIGDLDGGYRFGQIAVHLLDRFGARELKPRTLMVVNTFIRHWKEHARATLPSLLEAHQIGMEIGDFEFAAIAAYITVSFLYFSGKNLEKLEQEIYKYHDILQRIRQKRASNMNCLYLQVTLNLLSNTSTPYLLKGNFYDEDEMLPLHQASGDKTAMYYVHINKAILCYIFHKYALAMEHISFAETYAKGVTASYAMVLLNFYDSLTRLALLRERQKGNITSAFYSEEEVVQSFSVHSTPISFHLDKVAANQEKLRQWAHHAPMNHQHKWYLVEAERARMVDNDRDARDYYDRAIDAAREQRFIQEEALACELAAEFYLHRRQPRIGLIYLQDASYAYQRWGAKSKVLELEQRFPEFLGVPDKEKEEQIRITSSVTRTEERETSFLDIVSVIKTSQAIFGEIVLEPLLTRLMHIFIENAGAERGLLLLHKTGQWMVEAEYHIDTNNVTVLQSVPLEQAALPSTIVNYVGHTQENVILQDASRQHSFVQDQYIQLRRPLSVLCMPMIYQQELIGILYLENNLTTGAFTEDRVEVLHLLASQAAISIVHARLYRHMEDIVETRTAELQQTNEALQAEIIVRKRTEQELQQAKEVAEAANRAKSSFLATMSHELRTPLNAILGFAQIMSHNDQLSPENRENLSIISRSGEHLLNLINDVLDLSKIEAGRITLNETRFDLHQLIEDLEDMFRFRTQNKQLWLVSEIAPDLPRYIRTDQTRLRQIMINLLSNAVKFTQEGGITMTISSNKYTAYSGERTEPQYERPEKLPNHMLHFRVCDTGPGIALEEHQTIFEPFVQTSVGKQKQEGTGLGLAISQRFAHLMGGNLSVTSDLEQGATFTFEVPIEIVGNVDDWSSNKNRHVTGLIPNASEYRILVVDDQWDNRQLLLKILTPIGFIIREASNGKAALDIWEYWEPHLILLDVRMPDMNGYEVARRIRSHPVGKHVVIIIITAGVFEEEQINMESAKCNALIRKPFQKTELLNTICENLGICYIYDETAISSESLPTMKLYGNDSITAALATLPQDVLMQLKQTTTLGDIHMLMKTVEIVREYHAELAVELQNMVEMFRFDHIVKAIDEVLKTGKKDI